MKEIKIQPVMDGYKREIIINDKVLGYKHVKYGNSHFFTRDNITYFFDNDEKEVIIRKFSFACKGDGYLDITFDEIEKFIEIKKLDERIITEPFVNKPIVNPFEIEPPKGNNRVIDSVRIVQVIETKSAQGSGTDSENMCRIVTQYWDFEGNLLAENDLCSENGKMFVRIPIQNIKFKDSYEQYKSEKLKPNELISQLEQILKNMTITISFH